MIPSMPTRVWFRPAVALLLALLLAACGSEQPAPQSFPPLDFSYLPPLPLNVEGLEVQSQYVSPGPPDVSEYDPVSPVEALRLIATERLKPVGSAGRAVFVIDDAALVRNGDTITGAFSVTLNIYTSAGVRAGFAQATVTRQMTNVGENLPAALYTLTSQLMQQMNVEFEYQVRRSLHDWLVSPGPTPPPVPQQVPSPMQTPAPSYSPTPAVPAPQPMPEPAPPYSPPAGPQPMAAPQPPLPYPLPPAVPLPQPTTAPPSPMPALPQAPPPAGALPAPSTTPPPPSPPLPAPLPPLGPVQD